MRRVGAEGARGAAGGAERCWCSGAGWCWRCLRVDRRSRRIRTPGCSTTRRNRAGRSCRTRRCSCMFNDQGSPRGEREIKAPNWWMGMAQRPLAKGALTVNLMLSLDPATVGEPGLQPHLPGRRDVSGQRAHRSSASARLPDAGVGRVAAAVREWLRAHARRRAGRRTGARPDRVHAPIVGGGEPDVAARPSHLRLDAHRDGRADRGRRSRPVPGRIVGVPRRRARRGSLGPDGSRRARLVVDPRLVPPVAGVDASSCRTDS